MAKKTYKAVVFDMGGVVVKFKSHEVYTEFAKKIRSTPELLSDLRQWDTGRVTTEDMLHIVQGFSCGADIEHIRNCEFDKIMGEKDETVCKAIGRIREAGLKTALLTNTGYWTKEKDRTILCDDVSCFDVVVESCRVGLRKPEPEIFLLTAEKLDVKPEECIFIDDSPFNCKGAESVGYTSIHLADNDSLAAVQRLEELLELKLT